MQNAKLAVQLAEVNTVKKSMLNNNILSLPSNIILLIFRHLTARELLNCSQVCKAWHCLAQHDQQLWRLLFLSSYKPPASWTISTFAEKCTWHDRYKRLYWNAPSQLLQTLTGHADEVWNVAFSPCGSMFTTVSKDGSIKVWSVPLSTDKFIRIKSQDYSCLKSVTCPQFCPDSSKFLVSGLFGGTELTGIYALSEGGSAISLVYSVISEPRYFSCWLNSNSVFRSQYNDLGDIGRTHYGFINVYLDQYHLPKNTQVPLLRFLNYNYARYIMTSVTEQAVSSRLKYLRQKHQSVPAPNSLSNVAVDPNVRLLIFAAGTNPYKPHQIWFKLLDGEKIERHLSGTFAEAVVSEETIKGRFFTFQASFLGKDGPQLEFANSSLLEPEQCSETSLSRDEKSEFQCSFDYPDYVLELNGNIIGMKLSNDEKSLFVNIRRWLDPSSKFNINWDEAPPISENIEICIVDLASFTFCPYKYESHIALSPASQCYLIYLDSCSQFIASGSEDKHAYVWDRQSRCLVNKLLHDGCVNAVAFNPCDPEMLISVSDDQKVRVWCSRRWMQDKQTTLH